MRVEYIWPEDDARGLDQRQDLTRVEKELAEARSGNLVGRKELRLIEKSSGWTYEPWRPRLSKQLAQPIALPGDLHN